MSGKAMSDRRLGMNVKSGWTEQICDMGAQLNCEISPTRNFLHLNSDHRQRCQLHILQL